MEKKYLLINIYGTQFGFFKGVEDFVEGVNPENGRETLRFRDEEGSYDYERNSRGIFVDKNGNGPTFDSYKLRGQRTLKRNGLLSKTIFHSATPDSDITEILFDLPSCRVTVKTTNEESHTHFNEIKKWVEDVVAKNPEVFDRNRHIDFTTEEADVFLLDGKRYKLDDSLRMIRVR